MSVEDKSKLQQGDPDTTGHEWDGIQEFNNPLPRWWLWTFYGCILWALVYSVFYPAWPMISKATPGILGYSTRSEVVREIETFALANAPMRSQLIEADLAQVSSEADLHQFALNAGAAVFRTWCAQCHGSGAAGVQAAGYPNLLDDDWLWGGTIDEIAYTVRHGIRNSVDPDARWSEMPAFGDILSADQIAAVVQHLRALSGQSHDAGLVPTGAELYLENCASCHGDEGLGEPALGAPNLADAIWLYGGGEEQITHSIRYARFGVMPSWSDRLSEADIRAVALYVHGLGGGQ